MLLKTITNSQSNIVLSTELMSLNSTYASVNLHLPQPLSGVLVRALALQNWVSSSIVFRA